MKGALVVTASVPVPGRVKTALCSHLTAKQCAALYRRFLADTFETSQDVEGMDFFLAYSPRGGRSAFEGIVPSPYHMFSSAGGDTGLRLAKIFDRMFDRGYESVLVINSDTPDLPSCLLHQAVDVLSAGKAEVVFGPSERGNHYLIGLRSRCSELFDTIDWDGPQTARLILRRTRELGLRTHRLPEWYEIDSIEALRRHLAYTDLRRRSSPRHVVSQTGKYLYKIQNRFVPVPCRYR